MVLLISFKNTTEGWLLRDKYAECSYMHCFSICIQHFVYLLIVTLHMFYTVLFALIPWSAPCGINNFAPVVAVITRAWVKMTVQMKIQTFF